MSDRDLWCAVIELAIQDAIKPASSGAVEKYRDQRDALAWLQPGNRDFEQACFLAELDPDAVYEGFRRHSGMIVLLKDPTPARPPKTVRQAASTPARNRKPVTAPKSPTVYTLGGVTMTAAQWAAQAGVTANAMRSRLRNGWPLEKALTAPINTGKGNLLPHRTYAAFGAERPINEWCELAGIKKGTITSRLSQGMTLEDALTTPVTPRETITTKEPAIA
ncbi:hypothetical protein [Devosia sp. A449]